MDRAIIELGLSPAFLLLPTLLVCVVTVVAGVITGRRSSRAAAADSVSAATSARDTPPAATTSYGFRPTDPTCPYVMVEPPGSERPDDVPPAGPGLTDAG